MEEIESFHEVQIVMPEIWEVKVLEDPFEIKNRKKCPFENARKEMTCIQVK